MSKRYYDCWVLEPRLDGMERRCGDDRVAATLDLDEIASWRAAPGYGDRSRVVLRSGVEHVVNVSHEVLRKAIVGPVER